MTGIKILQLTRDPQVSISIHRRRTKTASFSGEAFSTSYRDLVFNFTVRPRSPLGLIPTLDIQLQYEGHDHPLHENTVYSSVYSASILCGTELRYLKLLSLALQQQYSE